VVNYDALPQDAAAENGQSGWRLDRKNAGDSLERHAIARARQGDEAGLRFLYIRYSRDVYRYVRSILRDEHDAEDVTQNVFAKLTPALASYQPREVPFSAWILRVARNAALDWLRRRRTVSYEEMRDDDGRYDHRDEGSNAALHEALAELTEEQRRVVLMRHVVGLTPPEIAKQLGKSEGSIHQLHHRARGNLKRALVRAAVTPATRTT